MSIANPVYVWENGRELPITEDHIARLARSIVKYEGACWEWTAGVGRAGYGRMHIGGLRLGGQAQAHRLAYSIWVGRVPTGLTLDHVCHGMDPACEGGVTCRHRRCVNPAHLEPVTQRVNVLRSRSFVAVNAAKTHCYKGHPFTPENTYRYPNTGKRGCRICIRAHSQVRNAQKAGVPRPPSMYDLRTSRAKKGALNGSATL